MSATAKRPRRKFTREQRVQMRTRARLLRAEGRSYSEIAKEFGVSPRHACGLAVASERPRLPGETIPNLIRDRAFQMFDAGRSALSVAIQCNIHQTTANRWLRLHRIKSHKS